MSSHYEHEPYDNGNRERRGRDNERNRDSLRGRDGGRGRDRGDRGKFAKLFNLMLIINKF